MQIETGRFGLIPFTLEEVLVLPDGLLDYPAHRRWLLLSDAQSPKLYWLQSLDEAELALPVVSSADSGVAEFRFDQDSLDQLADLNDEDDQACPVALLVLERTEQSVSLDRDRPILINPVRRIGWQFACRPVESIESVRNAEPVPLRKVA